MSLAVVIPWRTDGGHRERVWRILEPLWADVDVELVLCDDDVQPFSVPRLVNAAIERIGHDVVMLYGADQFPHPQAITEALERIEAGWAWTHVFGSVAYLTEACTDRILAGEAPVFEVGETLPLAPGLLMYRRDVWLDVGGYDPRFVGWGYGDTAQIDALNTLYPIPAEVPTHQLVELWHPPAKRVRSGQNPNYHLYRQRYAPAAGNPGLMRQVVNEWRA
jgi:hypothetical protein